MFDLFKSENLAILTIGGVSAKCTMKFEMIHTERGSELGRMKSRNRMKKSRDEDMNVVHIQGGSC